ncbi:hypothetical protein V8C34DRAFT_269447 [Trichoderma compactum]
MAKVALQTMMLGWYVFALCIMCQGPNREAEDEDGNGNGNGNGNGDLDLICSLALLLLFSLDYIPFVPVIKRCCFLLLLVVCVCTTAQKVPDMHSLQPGGRLDSGLLQMDCSCCWGTSGDGRFGSAEPDRCKGERREGE